MNNKEYYVRQCMVANSDLIDTIKNVTFSRVTQLLGTKGNEYSSDNNRVENFNDGSAIEDLPPERILWFFMLKHIISVRKFVNELDTEGRRPYNQWVEKIDDIIAYLIILKTMIARRNQIEDLVDAHTRTQTESKADGPDGNETDGYSDVSEDFDRLNWTGPEPEDEESLGD